MDAKEMGEIYRKSSQGTAYDTGRTWSKGRGDG